MLDVNKVEGSRLLEQVRLDGMKSQEERNILGQFATPPALALEILEYVRSMWSSSTGVRFLDPAIGTGSFYSALLRSFGESAIHCADGYEVDQAFAAAARSLWSDTGLTVHGMDFTCVNPGHHKKYNLIVSNPPYVRHHHMSIGYKLALQQLVAQRLGIKTSGLSGLYSFFLLLCDSWLEPEGIGVWLIPSEFMDVNYGEAIRTYLTTKVELIRIHRFCPSDIQFTDALVSSSIVVFRKCSPSVDSTAEISYGGTLRSPAQSVVKRIADLKSARKWSTSFVSTSTRDAQDGHILLNDLFDIKRGLATGANNFFILSRAEADEFGIPGEFRRPILPGPRYLQDDVIERDADGYPDITPRLILVDCQLQEDEVQERYPQFWRYLSQGKKSGIEAKYLASRRMPWYSQERRPAAPFVSTYMGRPRSGNKPFRLIWNKSDATAHNVYLMLYPKSDLAAALKSDPSLYGVLFEHLRNLETDSLVGEGRVYGGGLHKIEPRELGRVPVRNLPRVLSSSSHYRKQSVLF